MMETRNQSNFVLVLACFGVVVFHLIGDDTFYIGYAGTLKLGMLQSYYSSHGFLQTLLVCIKGSTAIIGVFLINSGYGLYKTSGRDTSGSFYKKRFSKIWIYCLLCGIVSTIIILLTQGKFIYSYIYSLIPVFGFYEMPREAFVIQYWYLAIIFVCYLFFPVLKKTMNTHFFILSVLFSAFIGYLVIFNVYTSTSIYHSALCRLSEFCFGILLAKDQKIEKYFFEFKIYKSGIAVAIMLVGYVMFYTPELAPFSYLFNSVGVYFLGVQLASLFISNGSVASLFSKLKGGTMSVYLLHLVSINFIVSRSMKYMVSIFSIEEFYLLSFFFILIYTIPALFVFNIVEQKYYRLLKIR